MAVGTTITTGQILGTSVLLKIDTTDGGNYVSIGLQKNATLNMVLEMIVHKIGRILAGNPNHLDHWVDVEGYARITKERL